MAENHSEFLALKTDFERIEHVELDDQKYINKITVNTIRKINKHNFFNTYPDKQLISGLLLNIYRKPTEAASRSYNELIELLYNFIILIEEKYSDVADYVELAKIYSKIYIFLIEHRYGACSGSSDD